MAQIHTIDPAVKAHIQEHVEERNTALRAEIEAAIAAAVAPLQEKIAQLEAGAITSGNRISLKSYNGQFVCAHEGGPTEPNQVYEFQSRAAVGPHEVYEVSKL